MTSTPDRTTPRRPRARQPEPPRGSCASLDDHTLLALILSRFEADADLVAGRLLGRFGGLGDIAGADPRELMAVPGVGTGTLSALKVQRELAVRLARAEACRRPVITSWTALRDYARTAMVHLPREQFRALYLDRRNLLLRDELVADGTVDHAPVYVATVIDCYLALTAGQGVVNARQCRPRGAGR